MFYLSFLASRLHPHYRRGLNFDEPQRAGDTQKHNACQWNW